MNEPMRDTTLVPKFLDPLHLFQGLASTKGAPNHPPPPTPATGLAKSGVEMRWGPPADSVPPGIRR